MGCKDFIVVHTDVVICRTAWDEVGKYYFVLPGNLAATSERHEVVVDVASDCFRNSVSACSVVLVWVGRL